MRTACLHLITAYILCVILPVSACATSAQLSTMDPLLPIEEGKTANGTASYTVILGSELYDSAGHLGATFPIGRSGDGRFYFFGDLHTWVKNPTITDFNPRRIAYTLEPGYYRTSGRNEYRFFIKHQSFHDVDFGDELDESYELYGLAYRRTGSPEYYLRLGRYYNTVDVDYEWDIAASVELGVSASESRQNLLKFWVHHVTADGSDSRSGFTDYAVEYEIAYRNGLTLFARYQFLHDLDRFDGTSDRHVMVGPRYVW